MKARSFQSLILAWSLLAGTGCDQGLSSRDSRPLSATEPCPPSPQQTPVFYDDTGTPSERVPALSEIELKQVLDKVMNKTEESIWFVRVKPLRPMGHRTVIVYLVPQKQTPRIREGLAYWMWIDGQEIGINSPREYVQVSKPDQTFTKHLGLPAASDLPFLRPDSVAPDSPKGSPMPDEELIRIVDFVRQPSIYKMSAGRRRFSPEKMPLLEIGRLRGNILVSFGFQHDYTFGYGVSVMIKPTSTGYEVVSCGEWVS